jgi:hypothetical protein
MAAWLNKPNIATNRWSISKVKGKVVDPTEAIACAIGQPGHVDVNEI